ncbi:MAG: cytochrome c oxidase subunit I [Chloroflexia bacterium]|nr:cytochrome c oxidase subunit I [Chloroflexia bacterium]
MAAIVHPQRVPAPAYAAPKPEATGLWSWLTTIDHKRIGILYGTSAIFFFLLGGLEALIIRTQLIRPENSLVSDQRYNELFTMHGTTMIFLAIMPMSAAFFNYIVPLQIGARDVAFPRLNAFSYWVFLAGGIILNLSWFFNMVPDTGWYGYAPLTSIMFSPADNVDFWALGIQVLGLASLAAAFNFIVTIINLRAPGMTMMRLPIFTWATLIVNVLIAMAFPAITIALALLSFDRFVGTSFFSAYNLVDGNLITTGGDPLLWQHLFWVFGHPEVYILVLPAFGIVSEIIPTFARKPLFGYAVMVYALAAIAFLGFGVWVHHMFTTGLGPTVDSVFAGTTMLIAIPTGVKILNWVATMWGGSMVFPTAMLFAIGLVSQFTIGGLSGVMHAVVPVDQQHNDSYFVVAHFHYVLFGGSIFAIFAGIYYWWPKISGHLLDERLGKMHFWLQFIGFNMTFFPMHFLGLAGMPRRYSSYGEESGWWFWNVVASIGAYLIAISILLFLYNVARSLRDSRRAGDNPWDAGTLEWAMSSPPPVYNFRDIPVVTHRDPLWAEKYGSHAVPADEGTLDVTLGGAKVGEADVADEDPGKQIEHRMDTDDTHDIHMPNPSFYPLVAALGIFLAALGLLVNNPWITFQLLSLPSLSVLGLLIMIFGIYGWSFEPAG